MFTHKRVERAAKLMSGTNWNTHAQRETEAAEQRERERERKKEKERETEREAGVLNTQKHRVIETLKTLEKLSSPEWKYFQVAHTVSYGYSSSK